MSIISIDYDHTYTADPALWDSFIASAKRRGHTVICVTLRKPTSLKGQEVSKWLAYKVDAIVFTSGKAKDEAVLVLGWDVDIWIDDDVQYILKDKK